MYKRTGPVNKETQPMLRAAAILPVFALKKNFEFGWKPAVHILDNNAVSIGTTLQPAGLEASKGVISVNYSNDHRSELAGHSPARRNISTSWRSTMRTATHNRQVQARKNAAFAA